MPILMDRHELAGVSAQQATEAHLKDLGIQRHYGVKFLIYWFNEARSTNFCLVQTQRMRLIAFITKRMAPWPAPWSRSIWQRSKFLSTVSVIWSRRRQDGLSSSSLVSGRSLVNEGRGLAARPL
jgi:hypothetical protein